MLEAKVIELLPNGMTKVDLRNDERRKYLFERGVLDDLARRALERAEKSGPTNGASLMQYDVVSERGLDVLVDKVNARLQDGWELHGGLCCSAFARVSGSIRDGDGSIDSDGDYEYAQALVKRV